MLDRFRPTMHRRPVSAQIKPLVSMIWITASLALPVLGFILMQGIGDLPINEDGQPVYEVLPGDTLGVIAARYEVSIEGIMQSNGLVNPDVIHVGQVLVIPIPIEAVGGVLHTVQSGESLAMIAYRYGVGVDTILEANGLADVNAITAGLELVIPNVGDPTIESDTSYILQRGDSLYRVALIFGVSVDDLMAANNLPNANAIYPGLEIRIPSPQVQVVGTEAASVEGPAGGRTHVVRGDESLADIAIAYSVTVDGLGAANGLGSLDAIYPGQLLNIPEAGAAARQFPAQTAVSHTIQSGETLYEIALRYGVTVHTLSVANGIANTARISEGAVLSIPSVQAGSSSSAYGQVGAGACASAELRGVGTGYFIRPVRSYKITQNFHGGHTGIDLARETGELIYASDGGTVVFSGWNSAGYGNLIILDHGNGWRSYYAHLNSIHTNCGEWIPRGAIIGEMGSTGNSTGPHLHFEILRFGIVVNPAGYIRF